MNVIFRVDASRRIGTGHIMRCLALAGGLRERGANVSFVCADLEGNLIGYLRESGYTVHSLSRPAPTPDTEPSDEASPYESWLGAPWQIDAEQTRAAIESEDLPIDCMVVDHYALDLSWEEAMAPLARRILVIDDLADRKHACDILLDQNLSDDEARYRNFVDKNAIILLGPRYALLRPEFAEARRNSNIRKDGLRRLLIMFGGFDETGETFKALRGLADDSDIELDVVISERNRYREEIERFASNLKHVSLFIQPSDIARIMSRADFSLGAGGVTLWERCAVRLPSASTVVAENQLAQVQAATEAGLTFLAGEGGSTDETSYRETVNMIRRNPAMLKRMSLTCGHIVDGRGVERVVKRIMIERISTRPARASDCMRVLEWRNDPLIRSRSTDSKPIPEQQHRDWYMRTIENPERILLIGEADGDDVGIVRYDLEDKKATVSIYLNPEFVGSGIGGRLLAAAETHLRQHAPRIREIHAHVLPTNIGSQLMFERAGYTRTSMDMVKRL